MVWLNTVLVLVAVAVVGVIVFGWLSASGFVGRIARLRERLLDEQAAESGAPELPEIVRAYAIRAGGQQGTVRAVRLQHRAQLSIDRKSAPLAVTAEQWMGVHRPSLLWSASGTMSGLPVTVFDAYVGGVGELRARLLGAFQVAGGTGADYDRGELIRYLSELPVHPDAILSNGALTWRSLEPRTVEVTGHSRSGPASVRFYFDGMGDIARIEADDRPMSRSDGTTAPTAWHGSYSDYRRFGHYRIPSYGEVGWVLPEGLFTYWRGTVTQYEAIA